MTLDQALRDAVRREMAAELAPLKAMAEQFRLLAARLAPLMGGDFSIPGQLKRRGRPVGSIKAGRGTSRRGPKATNDRPCAIVGCKRPSRVKGYCAAHYQKLRNLQKSNRLPSTWVDFPAAHSIPDVKLPRGRAAAVKVPMEAPSEIATPAF